MSKPGKTHHHSRSHQGRCPVQPLFADRSRAAIGLGDDVCGFRLFPRRGGGVSWELTAKRQGIATPRQGHGLNLADVLLAAALYVITGLGVTVGFHRLLTHRSFTAVPVLRVALAIAGPCARSRPRSSPCARSLALPFGAGWLIGGSRSARSVIICLRDLPSRAASVHRRARPPTRRP